MAPSRTCCLALVAASFALAPRVALAQDPPAPAPAPVTAPVTQGIPPHSIVWHRWLVLDPFLSWRDKHVDFALVREHPPGAPSGADQGGFALGFGQIYESRASFLFTRFERNWLFRTTGDAHVVLTLPEYQVLAGPRLGPLEVAGGFGLGFLNVHFGGGGFGLGLFSPRAVADAALTFGPVRVGVQAYEEYAWRWMNGPSDFVRGLILEVGLVSPPNLPEKYRLEP
jgi:hypothetical protein